MAEYQLTHIQGVVLRVADQANIPDDMGNRDWVEYQEWIEAGGVPEPYVEPEPGERQPSPEQTLMLDHENRIRAIEGQPPITMAQFLDKMIPK